MTGDQTAQLAWGIGAIVLVASGLIARRLPIGQIARMIAAWIVIFGLLLVGYAYRDIFADAWRRVAGDLSGARVEGGMLRVPMSADGHFWVTASVNGRSARFLIDSGATTTALSIATATAAGVTVDESGFAVTLNTANGQISARRARVEKLKVGPISAHDLAVVVSPAFGETNVLGMNFLSALRSWRVEGRTLVLEPPEITS